LYFPDFVPLFVLSGQIFLSTSGYSDDSVVWLLSSWDSYSAVIGIMCGSDRIVVILWTLLR
jgi:hypothetical protein